LGIEKLFKQSTIDISTKFVGERIYRYSWPQDNILPPYFSTNVSYKYQISAINKFETYIHLNSENIFDTQYQSVYGFPVPGRSYTLTITIKERK
jgi:outer membrane cobalamin receptor